MAGPDRNDFRPGRWGARRILLVIGAIFILLLAVNLLSRVHGDPGEKARLEPQTRQTEQAAPPSPQ